MALYDFFKLLDGKDHIRIKLERRISNTVFCVILSRYQRIFWSNKCCKEEIWA